MELGRIYSLVSEKKYIYCKRAPMVRMHCKPPLLQHPLTNCHIITLREMQKIKMNTTTPNQNKYNTKNTLASRPN
jgi:hypothetical protein